MARRGPPADADYLAAAQLVRACPARVCAHSSHSAVSLSHTPRLH